MIPVTLTVSLIVVHTDFSMHPDRWIDHGPGGGGWASASFDAPRHGTQRTYFADGTFVVEHWSSEGYEEPACEGDLLAVAAYPFEIGTCPIARWANSSDDIPF